MGLVDAEERLRTFQQMTGKKINILSDRRTDRVPNTLNSSLIRLLPDMLILTAFSALTAIWSTSSKNGRRMCFTLGLGTRTGAMRPNASPNANPDADA